MAEHEDLNITLTEGYKPGEKKTVDEYAKLDAGDESLNRWKASLGLAAGKPLGDPNDPRKVIIEEMALEVTGQPDIVVNLTQPDALKTLTNHPFSITEGSEYRMKIKFRVQHEVISGLRYLQVVKRKGIRVDKSDEMMGSYGPNTQDKPIYNKTFQTEEAPKGLLTRGTYTATSRFADDDNTTHLLFDWTFKIEKA